MNHRHKAAIVVGVAIVLLLAWMAWTPGLTIFGKYRLKLIDTFRSLNESTNHAASREIHPEWS